jgi:hypothetical protein
MPARIDKEAFQAAVLQVSIDPERGYTRAMIWQTLGKKLGCSAGTAEVRTHRHARHLLPLLVPTAPPLLLCKCGGSWRQRQGAAVQTKICPACQRATYRATSEARRVHGRQPLRVRLEKLVKEWEQTPDSKVTMLGITDKLRDILED